MFNFSGRNLGERHRELNQKVLEQDGLETKADETSKENHEDIDKLFQIDVASRFKKLDHILDTLKSGDSLYVTRALKCTWIYDDTYANLINPSYLHHNIFPYMSQRMKTKMLTTISLHVRHGDRVVCFYSYCMNCKLNRIALKFLIYTPDAFKMDLITSDDDFDDAFNDSKCLKQFIGSSFELATAYVDMHWVEYRKDVVHELRFLYFEFREDYLDMIEKYVRIDATNPNSVKRLGIRISKDILKRHKSRVWKFPIIYANKLNTSTLIKYLTPEDVENLATLLLPDTASNFWSMDFYHSYKFILDVIPYTKCLSYLKKIFTNTYSEELFEMDIQFYNLKYYELFTAVERESWALLHIEREEELFGSGNDYIWYRFVSFDKALEGIKRYVFITPDNDKRSEMVNVLIDSANSHEDLTKLFHYYYERHVNESDEHKMSFMDVVIAKHDMFTFTEENWIPFHKILYSLEIYEAHHTRWKLKSYVIRSMIYHILNKKEFSDDLQKFIDNERAFYEYYDIILGLSEERRSIVVKYWLEFHAEKLQKLLEKPLDDKLKEDIFDQVGLVWNIIYCYNRDEKECPENVLIYMKSNLNVYKYHFKEKFKAMTEADFVRLLKKDIDLASAAISEVMCNTHRWSFRLSRLFRKLKVYFSKDVSKTYLEYFMDSLQWLNDYPRRYRNIKMAVVAIFQLGDEESKKCLLEKYAPENRKIEHGKIDKYLLQVQKAICSLSYQSRPPIELSLITKYLIGDYVRLCLSIFNNYLVSLPKARISEFINIIIDSPISLQKHALRLAFECFSSRELVNIILNIWHKTKNVSLRMLLYKKLYTKMVTENGDSQKELYDALKTYTLGLNQQDHKQIFDLLLSDDMPEEFRGDYLETAWRVVSKFSNKKNNLTRKTNVINRIKQNINLLEPVFLRNNIIDEHVRTVLLENRLKIYDLKFLENFMKAKWDLTATYIVTDSDIPERLEQNQKLVKDILIKCFQMWTYQYKGIYTYRRFCCDFLNTLHDESCVSALYYMNNVPLYQCILEVLLESLTNEALYLPTWKCKLSIFSRKAIREHYITHSQCMQFKYPCVVDIAEYFAEDVGKLVKEMVDKGQFYYSFCVDMAKALANVCDTMDLCMVSKFRILTSGFLTRIKILETHVLAVLLMPKEPPTDWEKRHENVVNLIKLYDSEEIRSQVLHKFCPDGNMKHIL